ncbi:MAG: glycosyltransferase [Thermoanaerobaculia bacterium]
MRILYSFNKRGFEAEYWTREIAAASDASVQFIPFNHGSYLDLGRIVRAQLLDNLYYDRDPALMRLYDAVQEAIAREQADVLLVDNLLPYHPEFLRTLPIYKVQRTTDGPTVAYERDFAYVHAYDHVLYHNPAYSRDLDMREKLLYLGAKRVDFWPLGLFDRMFDETRTEETILAHERDIDVIFVGAMFFDKMPLLAAARKAFGKRVQVYGLCSWKRNVYFNAKYGFPGWVRPIAFEEYVPLYQRSKIGINAHIRGKYTLGSYRMFDLPGNGVMQICDGGEYLPAYYDVGREIVAYDGPDELVKKIGWYLDHPDERKEIALNGYRAVMSRHRMRQRFHEGAQLIRAGMNGR